MKNIDILKEYIKNNNGIILSRDLKKLNIHKQYIKLLCEVGYLERKERGVYIRKGKNINEFFLIQQRFKTGIFSHNTALYFYHLTDRTPLKYDMTFTDNIRVKDEIILPHYLKKDKYELGIIKLKMPDQTSIKIYDRERTVIDILRDRNKIDLQIFNTAIKEYVKRKDKNLIRLEQYAKQFKVEKILKMYLEVLL